jgi:methylenetetrahydrofolate reductase (NADPH)
MHFQDVFKLRSTTFSFEFFPPKSEQGAAGLFEEISHLSELKPTYVSVTYGAGGSTRDLTHRLVVRIKQETDLTPMPHLTCVGHTEAEIHDILERYAEAGISNILALGGDPPRGDDGYDRARDSFRYASQLVRYIHHFRDRYGARSMVDQRGFGIAVAGFPEGHPATPNRVREIEHLRAKVDEGADCVITQMFFDNRDFYDFRARCELAGINVPVIAGIMPVTSANGLMKMADLAAGARFPAPLLRSINRCGGDPDAIRRVGIHWATEQCRDLLDHDVAGLHFYTLNKSTATREVYATLGVKDSIALEMNGDSRPATGT